MCDNVSRFISWGVAFAVSQLPGSPCICASGILLWYDSFFTVIAEIDWI